MAGVNLLPVKDYGEGITPWQERRLRLTLCENDIRKKLADIQQSFLYLGYYLMDINRSHLYDVVFYQSSGDYCKNIYQYALQELDLAKTTVYNLMNVAEKFSNGQMGLKPEYRDYSFSQLVELLSFSEEQLKYVHASMSVSSLRKLKKGECVSITNDIGAVELVQIPKELLSVPDVGNDSVIVEKLSASSENKNCSDVGTEISKEVEKIEEISEAEENKPHEPQDISGTVYIHFANLEELRDWYFSDRRKYVPFPLTLSYHVNSNLEELEGGDCKERQSV